MFRRTHRADDPLAPEPLPDLVVAARGLVRGLFHGRHRTAQLGESAEFYDFRAAGPGDDARSIDVRLLARTDRAYVRRHRHDAQLTVLLAVDASASMRFSAIAPERTRGLPSKLRRAGELAAAVALLAARQQDRAGLILAGDGPARLVAPPAAGLAGAHAVIAALEDVLAPAALRTGRRAARSDGSGLAGALRLVAASPMRGGLVIALGDCFEDRRPLAEAAGALSVGAGRRGAWEVTVAQVLAPDERTGGDWPATGVRIADPERGVTLGADGSSLAARTARAVASHERALHAALAAVRARHERVSTGAPAAEELARVLRAGDAQLARRRGVGAASGSTVSAGAT